MEQNDVTLTVLQKLIAAGDFAESEAKFNANYAALETVKKEKVEVKEAIDRYRDLTTLADQRTAASTLGLPVVQYLSTSKRSLISACRRSAVL